MVNIVARLEHALQHLFSSGVCKCVVEDTVHGGLFLFSADIRLVFCSVAFERRSERNPRLLGRVWNTHESRGSPFC